MIDTAPADGAGDRGNTVTQTYQRLRDLIIDGHYLPGQRLTQIDLATEHGVGRTPLREALRLLEADGYVVAHANRGVTVTRASVGAAEDLYVLRLLIEPPLLAAMVPAFSAEELAAMDTHLGEMHAGAHHVRQFQEAHFALHHVALERYGKTVRETVLDLFRQVQRVQRAYMARPRVTAEVIDIDRLIVTALREKDGEAAKHLMEFHLLDWAVGLILDVEPDHRFGLLLQAAQGLGIRIAAGPDGRLTAPVPVSWAGAPDLPPLATANLLHQPGS